MEIRGLEASRIWDYENGYYWFSHPSRMAKLLAHYELYKSIVNVPGHVFELGVFKGASLVRFATFRELLENSHSRKIVGFDAFGKFPIDNVRSENDIDFVSKFEKIGGHGLEIDDVNLMLQEKGFENIELIKGNIFDSMPEYISQNPECRISLLHLDLDVREPTEYALDILYERVVPGGLIVFDDYNAVAGETDAVDSFLSGKSLKLEKLPYYNVPAFVRKVG